MKLLQAQLKHQDMVLLLVLLVVVNFSKAKLITLKSIIMPALLLKLPTTTIKVDQLVGGNLMNVKATLLMIGVEIIIMARLILVPVALKLQLVLVPITYQLPLGIMGKQEKQILV